VAARDGVEPSTFRFSDDPGNYAARPSDLAARKITPASGNRFRAYSERYAVTDEPFRPAADRGQRSQESAGYVNKIHRRAFFDFSSLYEGDRYYIAVQRRRWLGPWAQPPAISMN